MAAERALLASVCVATLAIVAFACSESAAPSADADASDASVEAAAPLDAGMDAPQAEDECTAECPPRGPCLARRADDLLRDAGWNPPSRSGGCSDEDLAQLDDNARDASVNTYADLVSGLGEACAACVLSWDTDPSWQPIVANAATDGGTGLPNAGACFAMREGEACGRAAFLEDRCYAIACNGCAATPAARADCKAIVAKSGCDAYVAKARAACPAYDASAGACGSSMLDAIRTVCGGDAG